MALQAVYFRKTFRFSFVARTSRGIMPDRTCWFIKVSDASNVARIGVGEAAPLPGLSPDALPEPEALLERLTRNFNASRIAEQDLLSATVSSVQRLLRKRLPEALDYPSFLFAFEVALLDWSQGGKRLLFDNPFVAGRAIPINGLVWMDSPEQMWRQTIEKVEQGFACLKIKIGALDFEHEINLLKRIRSRFSREVVTLRLDANGAFQEEEAAQKIDALAPFFIHSIEQPLAPGSPALSALCRHSLVPVALDEELIGIPEKADKERLLHAWRPAFIVLKPTLHGGLFGCSEWIQAADKLNIGWWLTSALESNVGLNAIAQFASRFKPVLPQGLGTGTVLRDNFASPIGVRHGALKYAKDQIWGL